MEVAVLVVAYNATETLARVLERIPPEQMARIREIVVFDDASVDSTYEAGVAYKEQTQDPKLSIYRNERNLGYGGNQKRGYTYCIQKGYDAVVLLHGDGQYAPEVMGQLLDTLEETGADAVFGSRMMVPGAALRGGMPLYKYVGNKILTCFENMLLGLRLSEFHSGYRLYRCSALAQIPYALNTDDFHFDTEIIVQFAARGLRIAEVPIPTFYGDEICYVNGMKYARDVVRAVIRYRLHRLNVVYDPRFDVNPREYAFHATPMSSHGQILHLVPDGSRVLDVGCGTGELARRLREKGCYVVGLDGALAPDATGSLCEAYAADPAGCWPEELRRQSFDVVILDDILEHYADPGAILAQARAHLRPRGQVIVSVPNVAQLFVRLNLLLGQFEYTVRGIMDRTHLRFFTLASLRQMVRATGLRVVSRSVTPVPFASIHPPGKAPLLSRWAEAASYWAARAWPGLMAYQFIMVAERGQGDASQLPPGIGGVEDGHEVVDAQDVDGH
jgi:2-polyprenyl-3-methyl-5-hydroxy-6-metoxy-1,4-benzoquinol methylase